MMNSFFALLILFFVFSTHVFAAGPSETKARAAGFLDRAILKERAIGKTRNAEFFEKVRKRLDQVNIYWGMDVRSNCDRTIDKVTYAYTYPDPRKSLRWINFCPYALEVANDDQLAYVMIHELAHQFGVRNEGQAEFVARRVFKMNDRPNPFFVKNVGDVLKAIRAVNREMAAKVDEIYIKDPTLELITEAFKKTDTWNSAENAFDLRPYKTQQASRAYSEHVWFRFGEIVLSKKRAITP